MKLPVPDILKAYLVDDWEAVTKKNQLVTLPRQPTVRELLEEFRNHVLTMENPPRSVLHSPCEPRHLAEAFRRDHVVLLPTIIAGLTHYFDKSLPANLLYRLERPQYADVRKEYITGPTVKDGPAREMSTIYGAEHLLRMLGPFRS